MTMMKKGIFAILAGLLVFAMVATSCDDDTKPATKKLYTVTFDKNNAASGTAPAAIKQTTKGEAITLPGNTGNLVGPAGKANWIGWHTSQNSTTALTAGTFTPTKDTTLYAIFSAEAAKFTVTFNANGGSGNGPAAITQTTAGASITLPATAGGFTGPSGKTNWAGWSTTSGDNNVALTGTTYTPTANTTLYAVWSGTPVEKVTITFNPNYPSDKKDTPVVSIDPYSINKDAAIGALPVMPKGPGATDSFLHYGLVFLGWYDAATGGAVVPETKTYSADGIVYAHWTSFDPLTQFAITFDYNYDNNDNSTDGDPPAVLIITGTDGVITAANWPQDPTRTGTTPGKDKDDDDWAFKGWKQYASGSGDTYVADVAFTASRTVYAAWQPATGWPVDIAPDGTDLAGAELLVLANASFAIYKFDIPNGKTWGDYSRITADYMVGPATINKTGGLRTLRLLGNYAGATDLDLVTIQPNADYAAAQKYSESDKKWAGNLAVANYNSGKNAEFILHNGPANTTVASGMESIGITVNVWEWFTVSYTIDGSQKHGNYVAANLPASTATGTFYFAVGLPDSNNGGNVHYVRNVKLVGNTGTASVTATPAWFTKDDKTYPAFTGYADSSGGNGTKEFYRRMCDGSQPTPVSVP